MMKIYKFFSVKKSTICLTLLALLGSSCTKNYEEYNTNQHQATAEMLDRDNLLVGSFFVQMQKNVFPIAQQPFFGDEVYQTMQNLAGDVYSGYMGATNNWFSGSNNTTYDLIPQWYGQAFSRSYLSVMNPWNTIKNETQTAIPQVFAIATIVKVEALHRTTDMYGPIPYVNFGSGSSQIKYDSQRDVYYKFFEELNSAIAVLTEFSTKNPGATALAKFDYIYGGNVTKWIKFANSLKLRLAMRIVYADPAKAKTEAESAVAHPVGVFTLAADIAALNRASDFTYNHPLYIISANFKDIRMGANMHSFMNGYADPRAPFNFKLPSTGTTYRGIRNGITISNKATYAEGAYSDLNISANSAIVWMNPAEVYFLRAEGALRGWAMGGTAQTMYETGIRTSFTLTGAAGADTYLANSTLLPAAYTDAANSGNNVTLTNAAMSKATIQWNATATFETSLEKIITQKWIAMYPDGQEAWTEFRRTGYPKIFPVVVNNSRGLINTTTQIRRLPFPATEYQTNGANVAAATALLGGADNGGTKLWWDKK
ncbi:SusD/RagB family nutrient-binding outer membrane lipoprotein [Pedobacter sp. MC2016-14]|uniref:RagB/SusD family nutrient uptake outer membrane protein n=1 Tax=Pedobacter sp. MC2016-14 TaxID=2897327 RepID=UPI001E2EB67A|nr:RagB/SusD family nutrient uptake outer membrane protein [Pedobacter sp. MC2016-14]MCD0488698.1 SusD/RagB family nutrient-binding outer membrane lipoprotein [Pedobacter sp. MC2016-14]